MSNRRFGRGGGVKANPFDLLAKSSSDGSSDSPSSSPGRVSGGQKSESRTRPSQSASSNSGNGRSGAGTAPSYKPRAINRYVDTGNPDLLGLGQMYMGPNGSKPSTDGAENQQKKDDRAANKNPSSRASTPARNPVGMLEERPVPNSLPPRPGWNTVGKQVLAEQPAPQAQRPQVQRTGSRRPQSRRPQPQMLLSQQQPQRQQQQQQQQQQQPQKQQQAPPVSTSPTSPGTPITRSPNNYYDSDGTESVLETAPSIAWTEDTADWAEPPRKREPDNHAPPVDIRLLHLRRGPANSTSPPTSPRIGARNVPVGQPLIGQAAIPTAEPESARPDDRPGRFIFGGDEAAGRRNDRLRFIPQDMLATVEAEIERRGPKIDRRKLMDMNFDPDTHGRALWRARAPHVKDLDLPSGFDPTDQTNLPIGLPKLDFVEVALGTNTYIVASVRMSQGGDRVSLRFWGTPPDVESAVSNIQAWMAYLPEEFKRDWAKTRAQATELRMRRILRAQQRRERFRRPPKPKEEFENVFALCWYPREWELEELLGRNLEALDAIRMEQRVYITKEQQRDSGKILIQILAPKGGDWRRAIQRISNIDKQTDAQHYDRPDVVLFKPVQRACKKIMLTVYKGPKCLLDVEAHPALKSAKPNFGLTGFTPSLGGAKLKKTKLMKRQRCLASFEQAGVDDENAKLVPPEEAAYPEDEMSVGQIVVGALDAHERNVRMIEAISVCTLRILQYFKGNLSMRIRLGAHFMDAVKRDKDGEMVSSYELADYEDMVNQRNCGQLYRLKNYVSPHLMDEEKEEKLLETFRSSGRALVPHDRATGSLRDIQPVFSGIFSIRLDKTVFRLEVRFVNGRRTIRWSKMFAGENEPSRMMHIVLADLAGGPSVALGIEGHIPVKDIRVPTLLATFAHSIHLNEEKAQDMHSGRRFIEFGPGQDSEPGSVPMGSRVCILSFEQRRSWLFNLRKTDWVVELYSFQNAVFDPIVYLRAIPYQARWGVQMWHEQWDQWLGYNSTLGVGERSQWKPEEWQFFPGPVESDRDAADQEWAMYQQGSGVREMLAKVDLLTEIVEGKWVAKPKSAVVGSLLDGKPV